MLIFSVSSQPSHHRMRAHTQGNMRPLTALSLATQLVQGAPEHDMASGVLNSWSQIRRELEYCRYPYWRIHPSEVKSLGLPGRALGEPISGDVGDVLRYWVYHGLPHDSGDPLFGGSESRLPSPFVCFSLQLIETWFLVHVTFFHGSLTLCGELWMPTKRIWGMEYGWYWWLNHQRIKISPK